MNVLDLMEESIQKSKYLKFETNFAKVSNYYFNN